MSTSSGDSDDLESPGIKSIFFKFHDEKDPRYLV